MNFFDAFMTPAPAGQAVSVQSFLLALLTALVVGQLNAWFYKWTYRGTSYQRGLTHGIVLIAIIAALSMHLVAHSVIAVFGLLGGMALIRFRTMLRDPRDSAFVLLSLVCGMAAGFGLTLLAIGGAVFANLIAWYLQVTGFGGMYALDSLLRFRVPTAALDAAGISAVLRRYCRSHVIISVDESHERGALEGELSHCTYKLRLRDPHDGPTLVTALKTAQPVDAVQLLVEPGEED
jgi:hypothetical protein